MACAKTLYLLILKLKFSIYIYDRSDASCNGDVNPQLSFEGEHFNTLLILTLIMYNNLLEDTSEKERNHIHCV